MSSERPPQPSSANGTAPPTSGDTHHEHAHRLERLEAIVGEPPWLDRPGSGIARHAHDTFAAVKWIKWAIVVVATALLGERVVYYSRGPLVAPAQAAPKGSP